MDGLPLASFLELETIKFVYILTRVGGIFSFGPLFSSNSIPALVRIHVAFAISLLMMGSAPSPQSNPQTMVDLALAIFGELLIGFILGNFLQMIFQALTMAGQIAATQLGLALANIVNPQFDDETSSIGLTYLTVASLVVLVTGGHREMFAALLETFAILPPGSVFMHDSVRELAFMLFQQSTIFAMRVAAPATVGMLLAEIAMGFVGRTVPQLNILSLGFSVRILLGLTILMVALGGATALFLDQFHEAMQYSYQALANLVPEQAE